MGNLIHAGENYHRVVEIVRSGVLGKISKTRVWMAADRSGLGRPADGPPAAGLRLRLLARARPRAAVQPQSLHVQLALLLGLRRRHPHRFLLPHRRPRPLGDGVDAPRTISATVGGRYALADNAEVPDTLEVTYEYEKGDQKFLMVWSQTDANAHGIENQGLGIMFQGTDATLHGPITMTTRSSPRE